jgi:hypothetical protein
MLWFLFALVLALPVLLGLVPGTDAAAARRVVLRCTLAGLSLGLLAAAWLVVGAAEAPSPRDHLLPPVVCGALAGAGIGLLGVAIRRGRARRRLRPRSRPAV